MNNAALKKKLPTWSAQPALQFPDSLALEQCSSETTALWKSEWVSGKSLTDLTGGLGIDCAFLSRCFEQTTYVEQKEHLCKAAQHNFELLQLNIRVLCTDSTSYLQQMEPVDCIYIDPARRSANGCKTVGLHDCSPDILQLKPLLLKKAHQVLIKLSPMHDLTEALRLFPECQRAGVFSTHGECKELVLLLRQTACEKAVVVCRGDHFIFEFSQEEEKNATISYSLPQRYVYEPDAALLKAGAFKTIAARYQLDMLHANSHLYTSSVWVKDFPGRSFEITQITSANASNFSYLSQANISVRNFPASAEALRKKWKLRDGGDTYLLATTCCNGSKAVLHCKKVQIL